MSTSPPRAIFVFGQTGCSHCDEYIPRFQRLARPFRDAYPIGVYDLAKDQHARKFADKIGGIQATPTTVVMSQRGALHKHPGALDDKTIARLLRGG